MSHEWRNRLGSDAIEPLAVGAVDAGDYLRTLLVEKDLYRQRWLGYVRRHVGSEVNLPAVCRVLAEHLWDVGEEPETRTDLARDLRHRIGRALAGKHVSVATVDQLADAFDFTAEDRGQVLAMLDGSSGVYAVVGSSLLPPVALPPHRHRTLAIHEDHYLDERGMPLRHRTIHVIESTVENLDAYPYIFDTSALTVDVHDGGRVTAQLAGLPADLHGVLIGLDRPLAKGETTRLEYETVFHYTEAPEPCLRRASNSRTNNVELRVIFHPQRLPAALEWCVWPDLDSPPSSVEPIPLHGGTAYQRWVPFVERTCVGMRWRWP